MLTDHVHQQLSTDTDCRVSVMTADDIDNQSDCSAADPVSLSYIIHTYIHPLNGPLSGTQPCIPPGSLSRVPASAGVRAGMSPLPGVIPCGM